MNQLNSTRHLVLFDIDGTLVLTGQAGLRAMNRACADVVGNDEALKGVAFAGRTDWIILDDAMRMNGRTLNSDLLSALRARYVEHLREEIELSGKGVKAVMPGIPELLTALRARDVPLGLVTGNFAEGARIKLEYFNLWRYFPCGAFGDDASDRNHLVPIAMDRARACGAADAAPGDVLVVGDTPHDIACARAVGARSIGVATGSFSIDQLKAAGADVVFEDLSDTAAFLELVT
jgi:phosphoglycolate phosphatase-like HAD superfamily hydrolase